MELPLSIWSSMITFVPSHFSQTTEYRTTPDSWRILERRSCCPLMALSPAKWPIPSSCHPFITLPIRGCFECPLIGHARPWSDHSKNSNSITEDQNKNTFFGAEVRFNCTSHQPRKNKSSARQHPLIRYCKLNMIMWLYFFMFYGVPSIKVLIIVNFNEEYSVKQFFESFQREALGLCSPRDQWKDPQIAEAQRGTSHATWRSPPRRSDWRSTWSQSQCGIGKS